jgi:MinD superfamily P-loop ATPase
MFCAPRNKPSTSLVSRFIREQRRALKKLAGTPRGLTEHLLIAHGFSVEMLSGLVHAQLAIVVTEPTMARRGVTTMIERIRITDAGRIAFEG